MRPMVLSNEEQNLSQRVANQGNWMSRLSQVFKKKDGVNAVASVLRENGISGIQAMTMDQSGISRTQRIENATDTLAFMVGAKDKTAIEEMLQQHMERVDQQRMIAKVIDNLRGVVADNMQQYHKAKISPLESEKAVQNLLIKTGLLESLEAGEIQGGEDLAELLNESELNITLENKHKIAEAVFGPNSPELDAIESDHEEKVCHGGPGTA